MSRPISIGRPDCEVSIDWDAEGIPCVTLWDNVEHGEWIDVYADTGDARRDVSLMFRVARTLRRYGHARITWPNGHVDHIGHGDGRLVRVEIGGRIGTSGGAA